MNINRDLKHNMLNKLNSIYGILQILLEDSKEKELIDVAIGESKKLLTMINSIK